MKTQIERSAAIEGWMTTAELCWLAEQAFLHNCIAEIGCYKGRSTRVLGDHTSGVVYGFDDFLGPRDGCNAPLIQVEPNLDLICAQNLSDLIESGKVVLCKENHKQIATEISPDMVFIDGDHSYAAVKQDIDYWYPRLKKGGLLCGHDSGFGDVRQAINERFIQEYHLVPGTTIWYVTK